MIRRVKISVAFLLLASGFLFDEASGADLPVVRASYNAIGGVFTPIWLAQENKLFNKYGISVDLKFLPLTTGTQALLTRDIDIITPGGEFLEAGLNGERVVYIAGIANRVVLSIFAKPEIKSVADLRGKVVSALSPGSISDHLARILFQEAGLTPGQDVKMLYLKTGPEILAALTRTIWCSSLVATAMMVRHEDAPLGPLYDIEEHVLEGGGHAADGGTSIGLPQRPGDLHLLDDPHAAAPRAARCRTGGCSTSARASSASIAATGLRWPAPRGSGGHETPASTGCRGRERGRWRCDRSTRPRPCSGW